MADYQSTFTGQQIDEAVGAKADMPIIRFVSVRDYDGTMVIDPNTSENRLVFVVEVIAGKLNVGDELQLCRRRLWTDKKNNRPRKYKLRSIDQYIITADDLDKRYIELHTDGGVYGDTINGVMKRSSLTDSDTLFVYNAATAYLRIARYIDTEGVQITDRIHSQTAIGSAKFSNAVSFNALRQVSYGVPGRVRIW